MASGKTKHLLVINALLFLLIGSIYTINLAMSSSNNEDQLVFTSIHGKLQLYKLGQWLRKRYISLIPGGKYSQDIMYVRSTDVDRTIMSALSCLAGMFYPSQEEMWSDLPWQPIPVHTRPLNTDKELLIVLNPCPKITEEEQHIRDSGVLKAFNEEHKELYEHLTTYSGALIEHPEMVRSLHSTMMIEEMVLGGNFKLPDWAQNIFPDKLYSVSAFAANVLTMTKTLKRLRGGPLLNEIITHMKEKRDGTLNPNRNIWMYSAHDVTIFCLLGAMGVFDPHLPPFSSTVMVELRKRNDDFYVSVHYKKNEETTILSIPGCTASCPLDKFESLLFDVIPANYDRECQTVNEF